MVLKSSIVLAVLACAISSALAKKQPDTDKAQGDRAKVPEGDYDTLGSLGGLLGEHMDADDNGSNDIDGNGKA
ncbi:uncharacterized protein BX664DRAFT_348859 [Halteromyces radiatus]|uniref:uncharacterized protein n=1 Tax=Halteromyces radiatus TaxID=101107 RepID=UPI00221F4E33|nr:uncharacterized protein BX664DRAFT_348859 [Halteromyces radiatus]KAI8093656.1 hypothetical protein BX664DRAFT_348859 [Halteromyces radiatus]